MEIWLLYLYDYKVDFARNITWQLNFAIDSRHNPARNSNSGIVRYV
jgi:hypothetical protein